MDSEIAKLAHLQDLEQQSAALAAEKASYGRRISERRNAVETTEKLLEENKTALAGEAVARRRMESDTDDLRQKAARYQSQLDSAKCEGQASALQHQIAFCKQEIDRIEELEFASLIKTESLETKQRELDETLANLRAELAKEQADAQLGEARVEFRQQELTSERQEVRGSVDVFLLSEYDRISSAHKPAVSIVEAQRCTACRMMIRPQLWNQIRAGEVHFCESCGRFLFYDPPVDLSDAIQTAPLSKKPAQSGRSGRPSNSHAGPASSSGSGDAFPPED